MAYTTVMFDWAGTITIPLHEMMSDAAKRIGFSAEEMTAMIQGMGDYLDGDDSAIHQAERGQMSDAALREHLNASYPGAGRFFDPDEPTFFYAEDRPEMIELMKTTKAADLQVVIASNNLLCATPILESRYLETGLADLVLNSADLGARKPDHDFFHRAKQRTGRAVDEILFLDDMKNNIDSATAFGFDSILVGTDTTEATSRALSALNL